MSDDGVVAIVAVALVLAWYLSFTAARLDRLHARVEGARAALDAQLARRGSVSLELAASGLLDPASSLLLAAAAHTAREAGEAEQELAESDLSVALRAVLDEPGAVVPLQHDAVGRALLSDLAAACQRVELARRFANEAVAATHVVRRQRLVRWLRLSGRAALPRSFEMDDVPPAALDRLGGLGWGSTRTSSH